MSETQVLEDELRLYFDYQRKLPSILERYNAVQAKLNAYGVSSPAIRDREEAKYQRGTRVYSDARLLDLIEERDRLESEVKYKTGFCARIQAMIDEADLSPEETELLQYRFEKGYSLRLIGSLFLCQKDKAKVMIDDLLSKIAKKDTVC